MRHKLRIRRRMIGSLKAFFKDSGGLSPVLSLLILLATSVAASLASAIWMRSLTYSFMKYEELQVTGFYFYEGADSPFPSLPEVKVNGNGENVVIDEPSNLTVAGSSNNVTVVGRPHNIWYVGGDNNLTLVSSGTLLIDVTNPYINLTQISGGWLLQATHPKGRPVIRGDIYLNSAGSMPKTVYIIGGTVIFTDSTYSGIATTVKNTGTCEAEITKVLLKWEPVTATPMPCKLLAGNEVGINLQATWVAGEVYRISLVTSRGNTFNFAEVAE